ncbi:MAG: hypothetical protein WAO71_09150 [Gallionella sp.]
MAVAFDSSILIDLLNDRLAGDRKAKLDYLIAELQKNRIKILIPTPVLTEVLVKAGKAREAIHQKLSGNSSFQITPFDSRAAMECALLLEEAFSTNEKRKITKQNLSLIGRLLPLQLRMARTLFILKMTTFFAVDEEQS